MTTHTYTSPWPTTPATPITNDELDLIEAVHHNIGPGPLTIGGTANDLVVTPDGLDGPEDLADCRGDFSLAEFIVMAHDVIPRLVAQIRDTGQAAG